MVSDTASPPDTLGAELLRVMLVDDHDLFRTGLRNLLEEQGVHIVAEAPDGSSALGLVRELAPDVVVMDLNMPGMNGIEATRQIREAGIKSRILIVTMLEDDSVFAAMRAGARGYLLKGADKAEIVRAIRAVDSGEAIFGPTIAHRLMQFFANMGTPAAPPAFPELTEREREILGLIAQGHSNPEIATRLVLSPNTVRNYVSNIFSKLQVADRAQAIIRAREAGLG